MQNYIVTVRAQISTVLTVSASSQDEAAERAQRLFESSHSPTFEMVMTEAMPSPIPPLDGGAI